MVGATAEITAAPKGLPERSPGVERQAFNPRF